MEMIAEYAKCDFSRFNRTFPFVLNYIQYNSFIFKRMTITIDIIITYFRTFVVCILLFNVGHFFPVQKKIVQIDRCC